MNKMKKTKVLLSHRWDGRIKLDYFKTEHTEEVKKLLEVAEGYRKKALEYQKAKRRLLFKADQLLVAKATKENPEYFTDGETK